MRLGVVGALATGIVWLAVVLVGHLRSDGGTRAVRAAANPQASLAPAVASPQARALGVAAHHATAESPQLRRLIGLGLPIYCGGRHGRMVALTFDDGPGPYTRLALAKFHKHRLHATFFVVGRNLPLIPGITRVERAQGAVGDHTFTHPLLTALAPAEAQREIVSTQAALARSSGGPVFLFRPPYGGRNRTIDAIAQRHGMLEIMWTVDSRDSLGANYAGIASNVIAGLHPGSIILMHENRGQTIRAMLAIFAAIAARHLQTVSVPQLLAEDPPSLAQVRSGGLGCGPHVPAATGGN